MIYFKRGISKCD